MRTQTIARAACALVLTVAAWGQETPAEAEGIRSIEFEQISHTRVQLTVHYQVRQLSGVAIEYGPDSSMGFRTPSVRANPAKNTLRISVGGLAPDREYYFQPVLLRDEDKLNRWRCPDTKLSKGYRCAAAGEPARFRTAVQPQERPVPPKPPAQPDLPMPSINGQTFPVAVDASNRCTNFQETIEKAAQADPALNHAVIIPAGATCVGPFQAPPKSGPGTVVVRTSASDDQLPPEGFRISPSYAPVMATLATAPDVSNFLQPIFDVGGCANAKAKCSNGWRFVGIRFAPPPLEEFIPKVYQVLDARTEAGGGVVLTVDRDVDFVNYTNVGVSGLRGAPLWNRVQRPIVLSPRELLLGKGPSADDYHPRTGHIVDAAFIPIQSCSGAKPIVCRTTVPHGLEDPPTVDILRKENNAIVVERDMIRGSRSGHVVRVEGSSMESLNGYWGVAGHAPDRLRIRNAPKGACKQSCGQATPVSMVQIGGAGRLNGSHLYTVLSDTEIQLDFLDGRGVPIEGGFLTQDPQYRVSLVSFGIGNERLVLDRCILDGGGFPLRYQHAVGMGASDSAILNSHVENITSWRALNPASGDADSGVAGFNLAHSQAIEFTDAARITIANNTFLNCVGITLFAQPGRRTAEMTPSDVVISRNTFRIDDQFMAGDVQSNGRYYPMRHVLELKRGVRFRFDGNLVDGGWADFTPTGPAIALYPIGAVPGNEVADIDISNNTFRRISSGIQIPAEHRAAGVAALPTARVRIHNNLFESIDFYKMRSLPSGVNGWERSSNYGGYFLLVSGSIEDLSVTHNTVFDNRGRGPWIFRYQGGRSGGVSVTDNIFTHNADNDLGGLTPANQVGAILPLDKTTPYRSFTNYFTQTPDPDPDSRFARNLILPGVRNSSSADAYGSGLPNASFSQHDCQAYYGGFEDIVCVGGRTARDRFRSVFPAEGDFRFHDASIGSPGVDMDALEAAQGAVSGLDVRQDAGGSATLSYRTAAAEGCVVDFSGDATFDESLRSSDSGSGGERYVVLEGLQPDAEYHYRIQCSTTELRGTFVPGRGLRPSRSRAR